MVTSAELSNTLAQVVESTGPSIVRVSGRRRGPSTGVVWAPGVIITAHHTVERDESVTVGLEDESEAPATVVGRDPSIDVAVLKVEGAPGTPASFSEGAELRVGNLVLALGRPGLTTRATSGIVSALGKRPWRVRGGGEVDRYLESDAPHQPGFSGGPLVGLDGKVLGMNTSGLLRGTSLTIPTITLQRVVPQLLQHGGVPRGYLGVTSQPVHLPEQVRQQTGEDLGLLVVDVDPRGPAHTAGIHYGDTILRLGGDEVKDLHDLQAFLRAGHIGESVPVRLWRAGQVMDLTLTVGARP